MPSGSDFLPTGDPAFPLTRWSLLRHAATLNPIQKRKALDDFARAYWRPLYCFLRASGDPEEQAKDLVQGFFLSILDRDTLASYDPSRGRFRTFLLACLRNFRANEAARARADKRGGGAAAVSIEELIHCEVAPASWDGETPDAVFEGEWARGVLQRAVQAASEVLAGPGASGKRAAIEAYLEGGGGAKPGYRDLSASSGLTENQVRHLLHDFRKQVRSELQAELREELAEEQDVQSELASLLQGLARRRK